MKPGSGTEDDRQRDALGQLQQLVAEDTANERWRALWAYRFTVFFGVTFLLLLIFLLIR